MTQDQARSVADKLTPNTRQFMVSPMYYSTAHGIAAAWFHDTNWWAGKVLHRLGLVERRQIEPGYFASIPNELCLEVRNLLLSEGQQS